LVIVVQLYKMGTFDALLNQVDAFIRKFYKNLMIKGALLFILIFLASFLLVVGLEYIGRFNSFVRGFLLFSFIGLNTYVLIRYIIIPLAKLFSFGKRIDRYQAAKIIGSFFPDISDKLLNTLQLRDAESANAGNIELLKASVEQNSKKLNSFQFTTAVDYGENKKYLRYVIPVVLTVVLLGVVIPKLFTDGSERLFKYNEVFVEDPDFDFILENDNLKVEEGSSVPVSVLLDPREGKAIPNAVFIESSEGRFAMSKSAKNKAKYNFENVNEDIFFEFVGKGQRSRQYKIEVVKRTSLGQMKAKIIYPNYLELQNEEIENPGDMMLPEGTKVVWDGIVKNTKELKIEYNDSATIFKDRGFRYKNAFYEGGRLMFILKNEELDKSDSLFYSIDVVKDRYPDLSVRQEKDTTTKGRVFFTGRATDDHGLSNVYFHYTIKKKSGETIKETQKVPGIGGKNRPFSMSLDINKLNLDLEDEVTYFFVAYDNDGVNGPKSTRSSVFQYRAPSKEELQESRNETKESVQKEMEQLIQKTKDFNEKVSRLKKEMMDSKSNSWQQSKQLENLQKERQSLEDKMKSLKEKMSESFEEKSQFTEADEELLEKQKLLEEMMENVMDEELKNLLEELEKLMNENDNSEMLEKMEESEVTSEMMKRQMDRTMEMLKRMDVEERAEDMIESLEELAKKQEELKEDIENENLTNEEAKDQQEELNKAFDEKKEELKELMDKNSELQRPLTLDDLDKDAEDTQSEMEEAKENLDQQKNKSAGENQQNASEQMQEMSSKMQAQMQQSQQEQQGEDIESMRALLENLINLSFTQENNMDAFAETSIYDPYFVELGRDQREIMDNMKPVKDSLRALADRVPKVASFVEQELQEIDKNFKYIPTHVGEREKRALGSKQQKVMTSLNNLALFMNEALQSAQQNMQSMMQGEGSCSKPGGKKGSGKSGQMQGIKEMLKKQLEEMKKGNNPGGEKQGKNPGQKNPNGMIPMNSKGAAKMAAEQGQMRRKLEELRQQMNKDGSGKGNQLNPLLKELEEQQQDLINKEWDSELIERQKRIMTRLLESEKVMEERGFEKERKSNSGKNKDFSNQIEFLEYKNQKEKQIELLRTLDPSFSKYYKEKANAYFLRLD